MSQARVAAFLVVLAGFSSACTTSTSEESQATPYDGGVSPTLAKAREQAHDRVTVFLTPTQAPSQGVESALYAEGALYVSRFHGTGPIAISVSRARLARLKTLPWLSVVEIDSGPPLFPVADVVPWGVDSINADYVQSAFGNSGGGVKVAFLDDGVACSHPDLAGRLKGGYDFINGSSNYCNNGSHGTWVAGVIAAATNGTNVVGVAPGADLYALRVCGPAGCDRDLIHDALGWAISNGMQVVTASIGDCGGSPPSGSTQSRMQQLYNAGVPQVWAAGNGVLTFPSPCQANAPVSSFAAASYSIAVSAHSQNGTFKAGYQYGPQIDISAPTDVQTTSVSGGIHPSFGGTSAATPHVAGSLALLIKAGFTGSALLLQRLTETAAPAGTAGKDDFYGWGLLRVGAAAVPVPRVQSVAWCTGTAITVPGSCTMTASMVNGVPPLEVRFEVRYSNQPGVVTHYGWGSPTRSINVPAGSYSLSVRPFPREQTYLRVGTEITQTIPVCTDGGALSGPGGPSTNVPGGCGGGGPPPF